MLDSYKYFRNSEYYSLFMFKSFSAKIRISEKNLILQVNSLNLSSYIRIDKNKVEGGILWQKDYQ